MATALFDIRVYLKTGIETLIIIKKDVLCEYASGVSGTRIAILNDFISYPDSRAYKIEFVCNNTNTGLPKMRAVSLLPSRAYNYAYYVQKEGDLNWAILLDLDANDVEEKRQWRESDVIIASELSVPFYFPVQHSYRIGGNVTDLAIMTEQISEVQTGQWPIAVLTDGGIYALEQGSGTVLYARVIPVSITPCRRGAIQTKMGVVYLTKDSVCLLSGRKGLNLSEAIEGPPRKEIRSCESFALATGNDNELYNITPHLSSVDFREYVHGAALFYDNNPSREEVIVSNPQYRYSYVLSLKTMLWHKVTDVYMHTDSRYAITKNDNKTTIVDILDEAESSEEQGNIVVHVQSRPIKLEHDGYKTIYRAIMRGNIAPANDKAFGVYIFASDDLTNWELVSAGQTGQKLPALRLFRSRKSYRFFTVVAGGAVNTITNIAYLSLEIDDKYAQKLR